MQNLADLRKDYARASLDISTVAGNPFKQFEQWFDEAQQAQVLEPNAMTLATVNEFGRPSARIVLLKGLEDEKFVFYTNYQSAKGHDLDKNPACALTFFWPEMERQIRVEGVAERQDNEKSEQYFQSRPRASQISAWASPQSTVVKDRTILEQRAAQLETKFAGQEKLPKPNQWGGYKIEPISIEFWQGRPGRLHDRILYTRQKDTWQTSRLAP
jgi:pyridoxamine 5'-phosphate oxidase